MEVKMGIKYFRISDLTEEELKYHTPASVSTRFKDLCIHLGIDNNIFFINSRAYEIGLKGKKSFLKLVVDSWNKESIKKILEDEKCDTAELLEFMVLMKNIVEATFDEEVDKILRKMEIKKRTIFEKEKEETLKVIKYLEEYINEVGPSIQTGDFLTYDEQRELMQKYREILVAGEVQFNFFKNKYKEIAEENEAELIDKSFAEAESISNAQMNKIMNNIPAPITKNHVDKKTYNAIKNVERDKNLSDDEKQEKNKSFYIDYKIEQMINNK